MTSTDQQRQERINAKLLDLREQFKCSTSSAMVEANFREEQCLVESPHKCLVLQFGAPLLIHTHVLLYTLDLDVRCLFDTSKLATEFSASMNSELAELLGNNN